MNHLWLVPCHVVSAVIVNSSFVDRLLEGRNPIGRRVRYTASGNEEEPGPWYEIVGMVGHLSMNVVDPRVALEIMEMGSLGGFDGNLAGELADCTEHDGVAPSDEIF